MKVLSSLVHTHGSVPFKNPRKDRIRKPQNNENLPAALVNQSSTTIKKVALKAKKSAIHPWRSFMITKPYLSASVMLHDEIMAFQNWATLTRQELDVRRTMIDCINTIARRVFSDARIEVSGSSATSLAFPAVRLDVVISTQEVHSDVGMKYALSQLAAKLKQANLAKTAVQIPYQNTPVLRLITLVEYGSFEVDISVNNVDGLQAVNVVNDYLARMPALGPLVTVINALLGKYGLNNPSIGGLSSYAITCMCIFFIKTNPTKRSSWSYDYPVISKSLGTLLSDFLQYFSNQFPYSTSRISAEKGKLYPNTCRDRDRNCGISVECLVNPEINVAETVMPLTLQQIINVFLVGLAHIVKSTVQDHGVLTRLVACDKNVRRRIRRLMESGKLETLLFELRNHGWSITVPFDKSIFEDGMGAETRSIESFLRTLQPMQPQVPVPPVQSTVRIEGSMAPTRPQYSSPQYPYFPASGGTGGTRLLWSRN